MREYHALMSGRWIGSCPLPLPKSFTFFTFPLFSRVLFNPVLAAFLFSTCLRLFAMKRKFANEKTPLLVIFESFLA
jgi:hypothetical protein